MIDRPDLAGWFDDPRLAADQPTGLGTAMAGAKGKLNLAKTDRRAMDYYPTPPECTRALLAAESGLIAAHGRTMWEPCGRGGAIARVAQAHGLAVIATDIVPDPANACTALDAITAPVLLAPVIITNPPFAVAVPILLNLRGNLAAPYVALLLKTTWWSTDSEDRGRIGLWRGDYRPSRRWDLTFRPDFTGGGGSTMNCSWFVWDANHPPASDFLVPWGLLNRDGPVTARAGLFDQPAIDATAQSAAP